MTPEIATLAQIGLKSQGFDPGPVDGIWGGRSKSAFDAWLLKNRRPLSTVFTSEAPPWLAVARKEIGVSEILGKVHNPRILEYHAKTRLGATDDETAWCASFACFCLEEADVLSTRSAWARDFLNWGVDSPLQVGAIAVFTRGESSGHVGFVERWDDSRIWLLGGNQTNQVNIAPQSRSRLLGVRWPV